MPICAVCNGSGHVNPTVPKQEKEFPDHWKVGQRVRYLYTSIDAWRAGQEGTILDVSEECVKMPASDPRNVFWTVPDRKIFDKTESYWTTPSNVEWIKPDK